MSVSNHICLGNIYDSAVRFSDYALELQKRILICQDRIRDVAVTGKQYKQQKDTISNVLHQARNLSNISCLRQDISSVSTKIKLFVEIKKRYLTIVFKSTCSFLQMTYCFRSNFGIFFGILKAKTALQISVMPFSTVRGIWRRR